MVWVQPNPEHFSFQLMPGGGVRFTRTREAGQEWTTTVEPDGWVTMLQAAVLLSAETVRIYEWVRDGRIENAAHPADGVVVVSMRSVAEIWRHHNAGGRGPGFPPGTFPSG